MDSETVKDIEVKHLRPVAQGVLLAQDMDRKTKRKIPRFPVDLYRTSVIDDIYVYEKSYKDAQESEMPEVNSLFFFFPPKLSLCCLSIFYISI